MSIDGVDGAEEQSESRGEGGADAGDDLEKAVFGSSGACLSPLHDPKSLHSRVGE
jgi:hypothetical protein